MKKVAQITVTGDLIHVNEANPEKSEPYYNITDTLTDDAAEIAALSQYDSAPLSCRVVLDADASRLKEGLKARPFLIKPNRQELEELTGESLHTLADVDRHGSSCI